MAENGAVAASANFMRAAERLPTLYALTEEWNTLLDLFESEDQDPEAIQAELERVAGDIVRKAHGVASVYTTLKRMAEMQEAEAKRLAARAKANEAHAERLRQYAYQAMRAIGQERIETGTFTLAIRQGNPSVEVEDASAIPGSFNRTKVITEPDKLAILDYYKKTRQTVPGTSIVRKERVDIR